MMFFLEKRDLPELLRRAGAFFEIIAPVLINGEPQLVSWRGEDLALSAPNPLLPPTRLFLPPRETLFTYLQESGLYTFEVPEVRNRLIFGLRPCDLRALSLLDRIMLAEPFDELYSKRRRSTAIIALNCTEPDESCFCAQMGAGPEAHEGFDLLLTDLGERYLLETGSPAGIMLARASEELLERGDDVEKRKLMRESRDRIMSARPWLSPERMRSRLREIDWRSLSEECISCGGCSFVCPTCHCFTIADLGLPDGERIRCADSCILSGFHRMASGANPKARAEERLSSWYMEKLEHMPVRTGLLGCVGCGRCDRVCFSGLHRTDIFR
ncbi:MAG: 4Fe-4S dicluster domain-containing protein [Methanothrix sp.]|uniref:4Fe-4S dicluster domain-containing protein n=1 Tax=Methanothrix sp. TaxID=90426 RepID=UPI0025E846E9|nr:4Fe-4S dicluster domain-containing protein [Methanothrix sp.]MCQ8903301.1 4Fe-4S dicluster domain-containing protein [Methanothrix sp.]